MSLTQALYKYFLLFIRCPSPLGCPDQVTCIKLKVQHWHWHFSLNILNTRVHWLSSVFLFKSWLHYNDDPSLWPCYCDMITLLYYVYYTVYSSRILSRISVQPPLPKKSFRLMPVPDTDLHASPAQPTKRPTVKYEFQGINI